MFEKSNFLKNMSENLEPKIEDKNWEEVADALDKLQASKNDGRGVNCVKDVVTFLRAGRINEAKAIATHDGDKISSYSDIESVIRKELFDGESYPYSNWYKERQKEIDN